MKHSSRVLVATAVAVAVATPALAETTLRFGHITDTSAPLHMSAVAAAEEMAACTNGEVKIEIFPGGQLGNEAALNNAVRVAGVDIVNSGTNFLSNDFPLIGISTTPYIFRDRDHALAYSKSDTLRGIMDQWQADSGQYLLSASYASAFHVLSNSKYETPEAIKGQRIRIPNAPAWAVFPNAVGAVPTPVALGEVYLALQQGVVDGAVLPLSLVNSSKFYEVADYLNLTYHTYEISFMIAGGHVRDMLNDAQWECLVKAGQAYATTHEKLNIDAENSLRDSLTAAGALEFVDVDLAAYQKATEQVIADRVASGEFPADLVEAIRALK